MIKGNIINYKEITDTNPNILIGLEYLYKTNFSEITDGKHTLSDTIYVNLQTYTTKSDADYEAHRDYIDIQFIIDGEENIGVTNYKECTSKIPYDKQKDIEFLIGNGKYHKLTKNEFMILYPEDAHKPSISINSDKPTTVRKAVVKVKL